MATDTVQNIVTISSSAGASYWVGVVKDLILCSTAIFASVIAIFGLNTWRKELRGKVEYEKARLLLRSVYKICEGIAVVRQPMITSEEAIVALNEKGKKPENAWKALGTEGMFAVYDRRWKYISDSMSEFREEFFEAKAIWGDKITEVIKPFTLSVNMLRYYLNEHLGNISKKDENLDLDDKTFREQIRDAIINIDEDGKEPKSTYGKKLKEAVSNIESFLRPYLSR